MATRLRSSALCVENGRLLMVRLEDPKTKRQYLFPPGGGIEKGEVPAAAAERETLEETGYRVRVDPETESVLHYPFEWNGVTWDCTTFFFLARLADDKPPGVVNDAVFHRGVVWLPLEEVEAEFAYHRVLSGAVRRLLRLP